ncbi:hypothetical protein [Rhodococcus sp. HNM0569]|uniref:hypothetical protein n=1 Tax=Rhodococcus sp. HNM0569 TaxID=2716340 RepID=UPI00146F26FD|nr:hypothetical protein [Rhodococcus sp. HNM0569]NLU82690.1 hypothetical protein [Rhodococcus sp. HNM0569]
MPHTGTVIADHHQFPFGVLDVDFTEPAAHGTLLDTGDEFVAFYTGISYGPATITVDLVESPPTVVDTESWDVVEETRIHATSPLFVTATDGTAADLPPVPAGDYRLRAHARGRDSHWANEVTEPVETYLITLWLTDNQAAAGPPTIETLVKRDRVWSPGANALPELDTSVVHIRDSNGEVVTVPSQSEQAWEVRHQLAQYGGKPLTPALDAIFTSRKVAGLDRDLLDAIEAATPDTQRALTRWCVRRAFERANLTRYGWVREALDRMDAGTIDEDFPNRTLERLYHDPNAEWTLATGLPAKIGLITQQQAISSYTRALSPRIGPLEGAIEALHRAMQTYGMDYEELTADIRNEFFSSSARDT